MALVWAVWCKLHDFAGTTPLELSAPRHFERRARGLSLSVSLDNVAAAASAAEAHGGADRATAQQQQQQHVPVMHGAAPSSHASSRRRGAERRRSEPGPHQPTQVYVRTDDGAYAHLPGASIVR